MAVYVVNETIKTPRIVTVREVPATVDQVAEIWGRLGLKSSNYFDVAVDDEANPPEWYTLEEKGN